MHSILWVVDLPPAGQTLVAINGPVPLLLLYFMQRAVSFFARVRQRTMWFRQAAGDAAPAHGTTLDLVTEVRLTAGGKPSAAQSSQLAKWHDDLLREVAALEHVDARKQRRDAANALATLYADWAGERPAVELAPTQPRRGRGRGAPKKKTGRRRRGTSTAAAPRPDEPTESSEEEDEGSTDGDDGDDIAVLPMQVANSVGLRQLAELPPSVRCVARYANQRPCAPPSVVVALQLPTFEKQAVYHYQPLVEGSSLVFDGALALIPAGEKLRVRVAVAGPYRYEHVRGKSVAALREMCAKAGLRCSEGADEEALRETLLFSSDDRQWLLAAGGTPVGNSGAAVSGQELPAGSLRFSRGFKLDNNMAALVHAKLSDDGADRVSFRRRMMLALRPSAASVADATTAAGVEAAREQETVRLRQEVTRKYSALAEKKRGFTHTSIAEELQLPDGDERASRFDFTITAPETATAEDGRGLEITGLTLRTSYTKPRSAHVGADTVLVEACTDELALHTCDTLARRLAGGTLTIVRATKDQWSVALSEKVRNASPLQYETERAVAPAALHTPALLVVIVGGGISDARAQQLRRSVEMHRDAAEHALLAVLCRTRMLGAARLWLCSQLVNVVHRGVRYVPRGVYATRSTNRLVLAARLRRIAAVGAAPRGIGRDDGAEEVRRAAAAAGSAEELAQRLDVAGEGFDFAVDVVPCHGEGGAIRIPLGDVLAADPELRQPSLRTEVLLRCSEAAATARSAVATYDSDEEEDGVAQRDVSAVGDFLGQQDGEASRADFVSALRQHLTVAHGVRASYRAGAALRMLHRHLHLQAEAFWRDTSLLGTLSTGRDATGPHGVPRFTRRAAAHAVDQVLLNGELKGNRRVVTRRQLRRLVRRGWYASWREVRRRRGSVFIGSFAALRSAAEGAMLPNDAVDLVAPRQAERCPPYGRRDGSIMQLLCKGIKQDAQQPAAALRIQSSEARGQQSWTMPLYRSTALQWPYVLPEDGAAVRVYMRNGGFARDVNEWDEVAYGYCSASELTPLRLAHSRKVAKGTQVSVYLHAVQADASVALFTAPRDHRYADGVTIAGYGVSVMSHPFERVVTGLRGWGGAVTIGGAKAEKAAGTVPIGCAQGVAFTVTPAKDGDISVVWAQAQGMRCSIYHDRAMPRAASIAQPRRADGQQSNENVDICKLSLPFRHDFDPSQAEIAALLQNPHDVTQGGPDVDVLRLIDGVDDLQEWDSQQTVNLRRGNMGRQSNDALARSVLAAAARGTDVVSKTTLHETGSLWALMQTRERRPRITS